MLANLKDNRTSTTVSNPKENDMSMIDQNVLGKKLLEERDLLNSIKNSRGGPTDPLNEWYINSNHLNWFLQDAHDLAVEKEAAVEPGQAVPTAKMNLKVKLDAF